MYAYKGSLDKIIPQQQAAGIMNYDLLQNNSHV